MTNRVQYKKEPKIEIFYQGVLTTRLVTCNLPRVQSLTSLITQIQWECSVQVKVYSQKLFYWHYQVAQKLFSLLIGDTKHIKSLKTCIIQNILQSIKEVFSEPRISVIYLVFLPNYTLYD